MVTCTKSCNRKREGYPIRVKKYGPDQAIWAYHAKNEWIF